MIISSKFTVRFRNRQKPFTKFQTKTFFLSQLIFIIESINYFSELNSPSSFSDPFLFKLKHLLGLDKIMLRVLNFIQLSLLCERQRSGLLPFCVSWECFREKFFREKKKFSSIKDVLSKLFSQLVLKNTHKRKEKNTYNSIKEIFTTRTRKTCMKFLVKLSRFSEKFNIEKKIQKRKIRKTANSFHMEKHKRRLLSKQFRFE